jgi:hypothetical protein
LPSAEIAGSEYPVWAIDGDTLIVRNYGHPARPGDFLRLRLSASPEASARTPSLVVVTGVNPSNAELSCRIEQPTDEDLRLLRQLAQSAPEAKPLNRNSLTAPFRLPKFGLSMIGLPKEMASLSRLSKSPAAGRESGPLLVENGTMELDVANRRRQRSWTMQLTGDRQNGTILRAAPGVWMSRSQGPGQVEAGRDLLWVGGFEDEAVGVPAATGVLWNLASPDKVVEGRAAAEGRLGARLWRRSANRRPAILSPLHRIPVKQGQQLSILGWIRGPAGVQPRLMVGWYSSRRGASQARFERPITLLGPDRWTPVRVDLTVPTHVTALGLNVILDPPGIGQTHLDVDGVRLILWEPPSPTAGLLQDWYRLRGESHLSLRTE